MKTETGFDLTAKFTMAAIEPPGLEPGQIIGVYLDGHAEPINATITKIVAIENGQRQITFATPMVVRIEPPAAG